MLPPAPVAPSTSRRSRWWLLLIVGGALAAVLVIAAIVPAPYVAIRPGSAWPSAESITVDTSTKSFPPERGETPVAFTTVRVGSTSFLEAVAGWLDDDTDVLPKERVYGDRSASENRRYNAQLMDTSKETAITVAEQALGLKVKVTTTGTVVRAIAQGSPAEKVLQQDDVIVGVDGKAVDQPGELGTLLQPGGPGATHELTVERPPGGTKHVTVKVTTVADPNDATRAIIGIQPEDRIESYEYPIPVHINTAIRTHGRVVDIGGPSAGLAFTLGVMDMLTPGALTGDHKVAVTGTMSLDGHVGPVGGGAQKAITVRNAGYDTFLVPSDEYDEVKEAVGGDLRIIPVDTLDQALTALADLGGNARTLALPAASSGS